MKKLVVIIIILVIIFIGMLIYKNGVIKTNNDNNINIEQIQRIETYITKIYMWKEVTESALPCFENINQADELWLWEVVKKNLEDYELTYEQIDEKAKELFGSEFTKQFPREGSLYLEYNEEEDKYYQIGMGLDEEEDCFLLNKIEKNDNGYEVEIVEYLEDYSQINQESANDVHIVIRNTNEDEIAVISNGEETNAKDIVKSNIEKFTKKKLIIKEENEQLYIQKVTE